MAFCISSFFAGVGGGLLAMYQTSIQAATFRSAMTYEVLLIVMAVVLFARRGIMGNREFSVNGIYNFFKKRFGRKEVAK